ncbi:MAG: hypothetical protein JW919_05585 [Candidatus Omnitrophica bacterium]|nr:hypothetical protein [Candidatus Omnitrophota bacterium]
MNKLVMVTVIVMVVAFKAPQALNAQDMWSDKSGSIKNADSKALYFDRSVLYLATRNAIYRALDAKGRWESVFYLPAGENEITSLAGNGEYLYAGTRKGLYRSPDRGSRWQNVFRTVVPEKSNILCAEIFSRASVLVGTGRGIFLSEDAGSHWRDISFNMKNTAVRCIARYNGYIFAGGDLGLYLKTDSSDGWERLVVMSALEKKEAGEAAGAEEPEAPAESGITCIMVHGSRLHVSLDKKILYSDDNGKTWHAFPVQGLSGSINHMLAVPGTERLYCATTSGVFEFSKADPRWRELYKGTDKRMSVRRLIVDKDDERLIWAATDRGLYKLESGRYELTGHVDMDRQLKTFTVISGAEPAYLELQKAAIRFADVDPEKIKSWHSQSRMRALLPKVSVGFDNDSSNTYEIYTSATRDYFVTGPEDISKGWDVSVSWELGNLIWSDDQTNIDVRSRLMVQLRNDILDDLRRVYYERKRLQFELVTQPPKDIKARFEKEMRLEELTRAIDDLTGNYLSESIKKQNELLARKK